MVIEINDFHHDEFLVENRWVVEEIEEGSFGTVVYRLKDHLFLDRCKGDLTIYYRNNLHEGTCRHIDDFD